MSADTPDSGRDSVLSNIPTPPSVPEINNDDSVMIDECLGISRSSQNRETVTDTPAQNIPIATTSQTQIMESPQPNQGWKKEFEENIVEPGYPSTSAHISISGSVTSGSSCITGSISGNTLLSGSLSSSGASTSSGTISGTATGCTSGASSSSETHGIIRKRTYDVTDEQHERISKLLKIWQKDEKDKEEEDDDETEFPLLTWKLLHWILTNPLTIKALHNSENKITAIERLERVKHLREETKLTDIPHLHDSFEIITPCPKVQFTEGKKKYGTFFAYHGSKLENFHSIIHRGLVSSLNERSSYGRGTYLTLKFQTACTFAKESKLWKHSRLIPNANSSRSRVKCIAIVEVVDDPCINWPQVENKAAQSTDELWLQRRKSYCCVVDSDHLIQLRYLVVLLYSN